MSSKPREVLQAIAKSVTDGLEDVVDAHTEEMKAAALELADAWMDVAYVPELAGDLQAREMLLLEKNRVVLTGEAHARLGSMRNLALNLLRAGLKLA